MLAPLLRAARRRIILRLLLWATLWALLGNLALLALLEALNRLFHLDLAMPYLALPIFAALAAKAFLGVRAPQAAAELDRGAVLKDRLVTALDLAGRETGDRDYAAAQLAETVAAVRGLDPARIIRVPPPLFAAPLLLAAFLVGTTYLMFSSGQLSFVRVALLPGKGGGSGGERAADAPAPISRPSPGEAAPEAGAPEGSAGEAGRSATDHAAAPAATQAPPPEQAAPKPGAPPEKTPPAGGTGSASGRAIQSEPEQLFSETVGAALTPVGEPTITPESGDAGALVPQGKVSFNLVPFQAMESGDGEGPEGPTSGTADSLEITVDFDAVPPEHREYVQRYFEALRQKERGGRR